MLKFAASVQVPKSAMIATAVNNAGQHVCPDIDMFVTSGNDGTHMKGSKHYTNDALDIRTHHLDVDTRRALITDIQHRLGNDYQLVLEDAGKPNEHLHIEYDPTHHSGG